MDFAAAARWIDDHHPVGRWWKLSAICADRKPHGSERWLIVVRVTGAMCLVATLPTRILLGCMASVSMGRYLIVWQ